VQAGGPVAVTATVRNTGGRAGSEIVQLYLRDNDSQTRLPRWQLIDFKRVELQPLESNEISFEISPRAMCVITDDGKTVLEPGRFTAYLGGSQPDLLSERLMGRKPLEASFTVVGEPMEIEY
jgi:beta-glucosidase